MGAIPVFESSPGWDLTFYKLPLVIVDHYTDITPALLEEKYDEFTANMDDLFDFTRLKKSYWMDLVFNTAAEGNSDTVFVNHPVEWHGY